MKYAFSGVSRGWVLFAIPTHRGGVPKDACCHPSAEMPKLSNWCKIWKSIHFTNCGLPGGYRPPRPGWHSAARLPSPPPLAAYLCRSAGVRQGTAPAAPPRPDPTALSLALRSVALRWIFDYLVLELVALRWHATSTPEAFQSGIIVV